MRKCPGVRISIASSLQGRGVSGLVFRPDLHLNQDSRNLFESEFGYRFLINVLGRAQFANNVLCFTFLEELGEFFEFSWCSNKIGAVITPNNRWLATTSNEASERYSMEQA